MISESQMKLIKRARNANYVKTQMVYDPFVEDVVKERYKTMLPEGPHAPNKREAKALRRICSKTGLTPEQVREHKVYRQELAIEAKSNAQKNCLTSEERRIKKFALTQRKQIARTTGLCHHHPDFFEHFERNWLNVRGYRWEEVSAIDAFELVE